MRRFEYSDEKSHKFWEISHDATSVTTRWGRIGTNGQSKTKDVADPAALVAKQIKSKTKKGYVEVGASAAAAPKPAPAKAAAAPAKAKPKAKAKAKPKAKVAAPRTPSPEGRVELPEHLPNPEEGHVRLRSRKGMWKIPDPNGSWTPSDNWWSSYGWPAPPIPASVDDAWEALRFKDEASKAEWTRGVEDHRRSHGLDPDHDPKWFGKVPQKDAGKRRDLFGHYYHQSCPLLQLHVRARGSKLSTRTPDPKAAEPTWDHFPCVTVQERAIEALSSKTAPTIDDPNVLAAMILMGAVWTPRASYDGGTLVGLIEPRPHPYERAHQAERERRARRASCVIVLAWQQSPALAAATAECVDRWSHRCVAMLSTGDLAKSTAMMTRSPHSYLLPQNMFRPQSPEGYEGLGPEEEFAKDWPSGLAYRITDGQELLVHRHLHYTSPHSSNAPVSDPWSAAWLTVRQLARSAGVDLLGLIEQALVPPIASLWPSKSTNNKQASLMSRVVDVIPLLTDPDQVSHVLDTWLRQAPGSVVAKYAPELVQNLGPAAAPILERIFNAATGFTRKGHYTDNTEGRFVLQVMSWIISVDAARAFVPLLNHSNYRSAATSYLRRHPEVAIQALAELTVADDSMASAQLGLFVRQDPERALAVCTTDAQRAMVQLHLVDAPADVTTIPAFLQDPPWKRKGRKKGGSLKMMEVPILEHPESVVWPSTPEWMAHLGRSGHPPYFGYQDPIEATGDYLKYGLKYALKQHGKIGAFADFVPRQLRYHRTGPDIAEHLRKGAPGGYKGRGRFRILSETCCWYGGTREKDGWHEDRHPLENLIWLGPKEQMLELWNTSEGFDWDFEPVDLLISRRVDPKKDPPGPEGYATKDNPTAGKPPPLCPGFEVHYKAASLRLLGRFGADGIDGFVRHAPAMGHPVIHGVRRIRSGRMAPFVADMHARYKSHRALCREWLQEFPEEAAIGLIPAVLTKRGGTARTALSLLAADGHAETIRSVAERYGPEVHEQIEAFLSRDPLLDLPARIKKLPAWLDPSLLPPPQLKTGGSLNSEGMRAICEMLAFSPLDPPYAGIEALREHFTHESLRSFSWQLFQIWRVADGSGKTDWCMTQLAHFGDDRNARALTRLVRKWPGESRNARAKKALPLLAAIGTDGALMGLYGMSRKLKFKALKKSAGEMVTIIAEQRGLTEEQLADRLVPDLALEDDGTMTLSYGPREFTVGFDEDLKPFIREESGKTRKSLPKASSSDDAAQAKTARKSWSTLKKEAKVVIREQITRLELAMGRRRWDEHVFRTFMVEHPLLMHIVRRLVWGTYDAKGALTATFRVAEDRTLSDAQDDAFVLPKKALIGLPHRLELAASLQTWGEIFGDYEIVQPFPQMGREVYQLTTDQKSAYSLDALKGKQAHFGKVLQLRKLGWRMGPPEREAIHNFFKPMGGDFTAELTVDPGLTGNPDDDRSMQSITSVVVHGKDQKKAKLSQVGPVMMSELIRDLSRMTS